MSEYFSNHWKELDSMLNKSNSILLSTHFNSDGDGLGSEIGMYYYLKSLGKDCRIINPSPFSEVYRVINPDDIVESYSNCLQIIVSFGWKSISTLQTVCTTCYKP